MQSYIEREAATETRQDERVGTIDFSFGTIGATREQRMRFWDLVEEHAERRNAVIQHRLILELPHEVKPEVASRHRQGLCQESSRTTANPLLGRSPRADGEKNDDRNYHAHIVHLTRPAKIIMHPEGGDDGPARRREAEAAGTDVGLRRLHASRRSPTSTGGYAIRSGGSTFVPAGFYSRSKARRTHLERERKRFADTVNAEIAKTRSSDTL